MPVQMTGTVKFIFSLLCMLTFNVVISFAADRAAREIPPGGSPSERFLKLIDRPCVPLNATEQPAVVEQGLTEIRFQFDSEANQRVTGLMVKPVSAQQKLPAVFVLHGTGGKKEGMQPLLRRLAGRGFVAVVIDGRFAGERDPGGKGSDSYRAAILGTWQSGQQFPFLYDTVWDVMRLVDYLETRSDIDPRRIGAIGFSKGGMELYLSAAVDHRIAAAVPCIGVQSFGWALDHNAWQSRIGTIQSAVDTAAIEQGTQVDTDFIRRFYDRVVPGVQREFDGQVMLPLIAPRPLLVINGDRDDRTPWPGLELCVNAAKAAYAANSANERFEFILQPNTGHAVTPKSQDYAIEWLVKHLNK